MDFRALNAVTSPDSYPLPKIADLMQDVKGSIFSKIDLKDAYFQVPLDPNSKPHTAVKTPIGVLHYRRMPFGLRNAASIFQRFIDRVLADLPFVRAYIDDIVVFSPDVPTHLEHLRSIFSRLNDFGLVVNDSKSAFFLHSVQFLGFEISPQGFRHAEKCVPKLQNLRPAKNRKELQKLMGTIGFYRNHVPGIADTLAPLTHLLSPSTPFVWEDRHTQALNVVKEALVSRNFLYRIKTHQPFQMYTDASQEAIGAVLLQDDKHVGYFSRKLKPAERNYSTFDRETLAIVEALLYFRVWVLGQHVSVYTDHKPLVTWLETSATSSRQANFCTKVLEFNFTIAHVPGDNNGLADLLSRPSGPPDDQSQLPQVAPVMPAATEHWDLTDIAKDQSDEFVASCKRFSTKVERINGVWVETSQFHPRVLVPPNWQPFILSLSHGLAHVGTKRTLADLRQNYYWPSINKSVKEYVRACDACQRNKPSRKAPRPPVIFPITERFQQVHVDIVGPLHTSSKGNSYLFTMIDRYTRWLEVVPIDNFTADNCVHVFLMHWVARYGVPATVVSDRGRNFESYLFKRVLAVLGVNKLRTTAYHPECNGIIERAHRTIKESLRSLAANFEDWEEALPLTLLALRNAFSPQGWSPAQLVFGEGLCLPLDLVVKPTQTRIADPNDVVRHLKSNAWLIRETFADLPTSGPQSDPQHPTNEWVYLRCPVIRSSLQPRYEGPYLVTRRQGAVVWIQKGAKEESVTVDNTKPAWSGPNPLVTHHQDSSSDSDSGAPTAVIPRSRFGRPLRPPERYRP